MRKIIYTIAAGILFTIGLSAQSQDSLLTRQMELDRDFNPTLMESNKINSLPALRPPVVQKANTNYSSWNVNAIPPLEIAIPRPGTINTQIPYSTEKGYLYFTGGNYANMDGAFGYRILDNKSDRLAVNFFHNSTNGDVDYNQVLGESKHKAKFMDNMGLIKYGHQFDKFMLNTKASYLHSAFNYYGNVMEGPRELGDNNQQVGIFNLNLGVDSDESAQLGYRGFLDFKNFTNKYAETLSAYPQKGSRIEAMVGLNKLLGDSDNEIGVDGSVLSAFYNNNLKDYLLVGAAPYINFKGLNWNAKLGVDVLFHIVGKTEVRVVPNVELRYAPLYLNISGGYQNNTFIDMFEESRYIIPNNIVKPSFSIVDINGGAQITNLDAFRFDIFGGYKHTVDEHFLLLGDNGFLTPTYGDLSHSHLGGRIQTTIWNPLNVSISLKKNFYNIKDDLTTSKAWNKPGFEADFRADLSIIDNLKLTLNYYLATDRWSYYNEENVDLGNINDLNIGAVYQIGKKFSVNLKANNLLVQKYDIWYGYPVQGLNIMGGFSFKF